ncbi:MAG TPA: hypothetical protein VHR41_13490 [Gemmatimonadales bacterium]|nr:hypothetical protein [Gemmatimonadales bacterium]
MIGGKLYLAGGEDAFTPTNARLDVYDPATDTWTSKAFMLQPRSGPAGAAYDPGSNTWHTVSASSTVRAHFGAAPVGKKLYAVGGVNSTSRLATNQSYTQGNIWVTKAPLPMAMVGPMFAVIGSKLYVVGGISATTLAPLTTNQSYTPSTDKWASRASLPQAVSDADGAAVINGVLYLPGGRHGSSYPNTLYAYNSSTNSWTTKAAMPVAGGLGVSAAIGGKLYVLTAAGAGGYVRRFDRYDPATNSWASLAAPLGYHASGTSGVINGKLYVAGGQDAALNKSIAIEVYDPATNTWRKPNYMLAARSFVAGGAISGAFYVVAGLSGGTVNQAYLP